MRQHLLQRIILGILLAISAVIFADESIVTQLDGILRSSWRESGLTPVAVSSDDVFLRRVTLDLTGRAPTLAEIESFAKDTRPDKRAQLIKRLLGSEGYGDLMGMRYADIFRIKAEFPINLWPNAVQLFHRHLRQAAMKDTGWYALATELMTASGSNFRQPAANFYRATAERTPPGWARECFVTFLGIRLEKMPEGVQSGLEPFFSRITLKSTAEWKEQIVMTNPESATLKCTTPDGVTFTITSPAQDAREIFAKWLTTQAGEQFARAWANRAWHWLMGTPLSGVQVDDMPPPAAWKALAIKYPPTPALNEKILSLLAEQFKGSGGSMKGLLETICNCAAYQADWKTLPAEQKKAMQNFAVYPVHRLDAEIIIDLLGDLTGTRERYRSVIPEPFTILPPTTRAVQINDGSISSSALDTFGRPPRDSGFASERNNAITGAQRLHLMNSTALYNGLQRSTSQNLLKKHKKMPQLVDGCYLAVLSRHATEDEIKTVEEYAKTLPEKRRKQEAVLDLLWCLVNSKEFLHNH